MKSDSIPFEYSFISYILFVFSFVNYYINEIYIWKYSLPRHKYNIYPNRVNDNPRPMRFSFNDYIITLLYNSICTARSAVGFNFKILHLATRCARVEEQSRDLCAVTQKTGGKFSRETLK